MTRVLDSRLVSTKLELRLIVHAGMGHRMIMEGDACLCDESPETYARAARFAEAAGDLVGKTVAWIGGGLCVGPRVFAIAGCAQTVFEIRPSLREFCPPGVTFVEGDWLDTFHGFFDLIVYDLGGDAPRSILKDYLNPGGRIL